MVWYSVLSCAHEQMNKIFSKFLISLYTSASQKCLTNIQSVDYMCTNCILVVLVPCGFTFKVNLTMSVSKNTLKKKLILELYLPRLQFASLTYGFMHTFSFTFFPLQRRFNFPNLKGINCSPKLFKKKKQITVLFQESETIIPLYPVYGLKNNTVFSECICIIPLIIMIFMRSTGCAVQN